MKSRPGDHSGRLWRRARRHATPPSQVCTSPKFPATRRQEEAQVEEGPRMARPSARPSNDEGLAEIAPVPQYKAAAPDELRNRNLAGVLPKEPRRRIWIVQPPAPAACGRPMRSPQVRLRLHGRLRHRPALGVASMRARAAPMGGSPSQQLWMSPPTPRPGTPPRHRDGRRAPGLAMSTTRVPKMVPLS